MIYTLRFAILLLSGSLALASSRAEAIDLVFRSQAVPNSTIVRLGDLAEIRTADRRNVEELAKLPLMPAPASDGQRYVRAQTIRDLLAAQGHDVSAMRFSGATQTLVSSKQEDFAEVRSAAAPDRHQTGFQLNPLRKPQSTRQSHSAPLSNAELRELKTELADIVVRHLKKMSGESRPWRVELELDRRHGKRLQQARTPVEIEGGAAPWTGEQRFLVAFKSAEGDIRIPLDANITEAPMVVLARRALARGDTLTVAAVEFVPMPEGTVIPGQQIPATSVEELLDCEVLRPIREGELITTAMYAPPTLVHRGDAVTVHAGGGGIRIRVLAKARVDGRLGEIIEVESLDTKERYTARVVGSRQLAVLSVGARGAATAVRRANTVVR